MPTAFPMRPARIWSVPPTEPPAQDTERGSAFNFSISSASVLIGESAVTASISYSPTRRAIGVTDSSVTGDLLVRMAPCMIMPVTIKALPRPFFVDTNCASPMVPPAPAMLTTWVADAAPESFKAACTARAVRSQPPPGAAGATISSPFSSAEAGWSGSRIAAAIKVTPRKRRRSISNMESSQDWLFCEELSAGGRVRLRQGPALLRVSDQGREPVEPMHHLAVGHRDEQAEDHAQMNGQQDAHGRCRAEDKEQQAGQAGHEQHGNEGHIHAEPHLILNDAVPLALGEQETDRSDQQAQPAQYAENDGKVVPEIRRFTADDVVIEGRYRGRGKAEHEAVEGQVMIDPAVISRTFVLVHATDAAAVQVAQTSGILHRLPERARLPQRFRRFPDIAPEHPQAHPHGDDGVEES